MLTTVAFLNGKKWTSMLIKRTYFGNWLRDYSQAVDVGSLKGVNAATIRILVRNSHSLPMLTSQSAIDVRKGLGSLIHGAWICHGGV
jgi:uncharacterized membrane protein YbaN (DUF454 family)